MEAQPEEEPVDIPELLLDANTRTVYKRMRFFGKGSFANCYEIVNMETNEAFAGKIISKKLMTNLDRKDKIMQEITIHKSLNHYNIVRFHTFFEDHQNIYIVLELCKSRSMMELHERREVVTEYECRYYMHQIIQGVKYLHDNRIVHRDLKLDNLFLDDLLHVKIGDFGFATRIEFEDERKKTLCGTPNYIAPEILTKKGHSFEADIWSIGCVMYTLLVGHPPFETKTLKDTYSRIKKCKYRMPNYMRKPAADMVRAMLQSNPEARPKINDLMKFEFMTSAVVPLHLPSSCLTMAPRLADESRLESTFLKNNLDDTITACAQVCRHNEDYRPDIESLQKQLTNLLNSKLKLCPKNLGDEFTHPAAQPLYWISKWVDYSDKYGFGYQLCDKGIGVMFNDTTKLILLPNGLDVHFIDKDGKETYMTTTEYSKALEEKMKLLTCFKHYMSENLVMAGEHKANFESDQISRMPHLHSWFRTTCAVVMYLTNGTVQLNFSDHMKIILCPRMSVITYMDKKKAFRTYRFSTIVRHGCSNDLFQKMRYAHNKISKTLENMSF